jgi:nitric oxide reductase subunit B
MLRWYLLQGLVYFHLDWLQALKNEVLSRVMPTTAPREVVMDESEVLSPWWRRSVIITLLGSFINLGWLSARTYENAPPVPARVVDPYGRTLFTASDIESGQRLFLARGLMENGTLWGHGAYLGPDFSALYLHNLADTAGLAAAMRVYNVEPASLSPGGRSNLAQTISRELKTNRYDRRTGTLTFTADESASYLRQLTFWSDYFAHPSDNGGLPGHFITDPQEIRSLVAFFAWAAWASVANRPGTRHSYTNNFPYDPQVGNTPTGASILWSALSLIALLAALAAVLFAFGRWDFLGWRRMGKHVHPHRLGGSVTASQLSTIKYFVIVALLFLAQVMVGGGTEHYRADPSSFYGIDLSWVFPSQLLRTWHLQLAIFWIATSYVAGGLFLAPAVGGKEPSHQRLWADILFWALVLVVAGSLIGEWLGIRGQIGKLWPWFGDQGWEYLDLGRAWQVMLVAGLLLWVALLYRATRPVLNDSSSGDVPQLFLFSALAIPIFYVPAFFYNVSSNYAVADLWRFWIIHLWVENFLELFATTAVALIFYKLGIVSNTTATRVVYLDALLYLGSGVIGTGHHWYFTGQTEMTMALGAMFSAMEVVPLTLLTLDAWDFINLTSGQCGICGQRIELPYKWTFYFLMAVGFWNFVGAGIFGFLINLPIVSYFEVGTMLTPNHGHAAMMGVFGMLAVAMMVFAFRHVTPDKDWPDVEKYIRLSFWGLNVGLALMVLFTLFPGGVLQLYDVIEHGYWHARSAGFQLGGPMHIVEWLRLPADLIFILVGVVPLVIAAFKTYLSLLRDPARWSLGEIGDHAPTQAA